MEREELALFPDGVPAEWCCPINRAYVVLKKITGGEFYWKKADSLRLKTSDDIFRCFKRKEPVDDSDAFVSMILSYGDFDMCNNILEKLKRFREEISGSTNESPSEGNIEEEPGMDLIMSKSEEFVGHLQASINALEKNFEKIQREIDEMKKIMAENTKEILNFQARKDESEYDQPMDQDSDGQVYSQQAFDSHSVTNVQGDNSSVNENNNSSTANDQNVSDLIQAEKSNSTKNSPGNPRPKRKKIYGDKQLLNFLTTALDKAQTKWEEHPEQLKLTGTKSEEIKTLLTSPQRDICEFMNQIAEIIYSEDSFLNINEPGKVILNSEGKAKVKRIFSLINNRTIKDNFEKMVEIISSHGGQFYKKKLIKATVSFGPNHNDTEQARINGNSYFDQEISEQKGQKKVNFKREKVEIATSTTNDSNDHPGASLDPPHEENIQGTDSDNEISIIEPTLL